MTPACLIACTTKRCEHTFTMDSRTLSCNFCRVRSFARHACSNWLLLVPEPSSPRFMICELQLKNQGFTDGDNRQMNMLVE